MCGGMVQGVLEVGELFVLEDPAGGEGTKGSRGELRLVGKLVEQTRLASRRARCYGRDGGATREAAVGLEFGGRDPGHHLAAVRVSALVTENAHEMHVAVDLVDRRRETFGFSGLKDGISSDMCQAKVKDSRDELVVKLRRPHEPRLLVVLVHRVDLAFLVHAHGVVHHMIPRIGVGFPFLFRSLFLIFL